MAMVERSYRAMDNQRLHRVWRHMKERCYQKNCESYPRYGGRGITVCDEWKSDFTSFCKWALEHGYDQEKAGHECTLDRIDNSKGYSPDNCRWVDMKTQCRNRRSNHIVEFRGKRLALIEWSDIIGVNPTTIRNRLASGWSVEDALTRPIDRNKSSTYRKEKEEVMKKVYTPHEVAKILHISHNTVYMLLQSKQLGSFKVGNRWKIPDYCVEAYVKREVGA